MSPVEATLEPPLIASAEPGWEESLITTPFEDG
jgi:hypothetical protein